MRVHLHDLVTGAPTWGLTLEGEPLTGPLLGFARRRPEITVSVVDALPAKEVIGTTDVWESGRGSFTVEDVVVDGWHGVHHPGGGNTIAWSEDLRTFLVTRSASWPTTWVHARFLLRHLIVSALIAQPDHHCAHAVVAALPGRPDQGLLVCGPTLSGKTRLVNRLLERDLLDAVVEDDCAVLDPSWTVVSLIPTEHELRRPRRLQVVGMVYLDEATDAVAPSDALAAADFAARTQVPWPASWLPGATARHAEIPTVAAGLPCLRVPVRSDTDAAVVDAVAAFTATL